MARKVVVAALAVASCLAGIYGVSYAADQKAPASVKPMAQTTPAKPARPANISMFGGTIENIDNSDPANVKIQVKDDATGASRTITVAPWTNVTKVTDITELKKGEAIRTMVRKTGDKDVAMGIMFGKIKTLPPLKQRPVTPPAAPKLPVKDASR
ncbi:MAG: hypothetical protein WC738_00230 [Candidatus Omnitrophota bacterium]|jgi:hypothetical protein